MSDEDEDIIAGLMAEKQELADKLAALARRFSELKPQYVTQVEGKLADLQTALDALHQHIVFCAGGHTIYVETLPASKEDIVCPHCELAKAAP